MSIVIIGGHDKMACRYKSICDQYDTKSKVFTQMPSDLKNKIGNPNVCILFMNTVSHNMVRCALEEAKKKSMTVVRSFSSSGSALIEILDRYYGQNCENSECGNQDCAYKKRQ
ncbi:MAG: DUF2325 domain-containing protein [Lachnospiraceae bacterium]